MTCLFNFAVSYLGGGWKRLEAFVRWFDAHGGARFIIHPNASALIAAYPRNQFHVVRQSAIGRVFDDGGYLPGIVAAAGQPDLYYSYGIAIPRRIGRVNWFQLTNALTLTTGHGDLPRSQRWKAAFIGRRYKQGFYRADVIAAESAWTLSLVPAQHASKLFLNVNGSDDEIAFLREPRSPKEPIATILGTHRYKALGDSCKVFQELRRRHPGLRLKIIGDSTVIPRAVLEDRDVDALGQLDRAEVVSWLRKTRFYISTTRIEGSYNAAAEGVVFADESYLSDIGPHREFLASSRFERVTVPGLDAPLLRIAQREFDASTLKSWDVVIQETLAKAAEVRARPVPRA